jgi:predicted metal-dependent phosphoesterase TrpH
MLKYTRNKLVSIEKTDAGMLRAHGVLDDDIYGLEIEVEIRGPDLRIMAITGKWNRYTTPECPRALPFLQEAVGLRIAEEGFSQKVHKEVGRKACRHYANLLLECCQSAKEALRLVQWEDAKAVNTDLTFGDFLKGHTESRSKAAAADVPHEPEQPLITRPQEAAGVKKSRSDGMIIDLHVHTSPASPCSSAPVDALIKEAKTMGLDGICLTDHNYLWDPNQVEDLRQKHGFLVLGGNEITTDQGDMLVFGMGRNFEGIIKLEELRAQVVKAEGFMIVAHPFRGFLTFGVGQLGLTPEKAMERSLFKFVDAVEVLNGKVTEKENSFAKEVAEGLGLATTGGSDAHEVSEAGVYATQFSSTIKNEVDLVQVLKEGNYLPVRYRLEGRAASSV